MFYLTLSISYDYVSLSKEDISPCSLPHLNNVVYYRPQTKLRESNVFTGICLSTRGGGGTQSVLHPLPKKYAPPKKTDGKQASGTHPTGMHTCFRCFGSNGERRRCPSYVRRQGRRERIVSFVNTRQGTINCQQDWKAFRQNEYLPGFLCC